MQITFSSSKLKIRLEGVWSIMSCLGLCLFKIEPVGLQQFLNSLFLLKLWYFSDVRYSQWNQNSSDWNSPNRLRVGSQPAPRAEWVISANIFLSNELNANCTHDLGSTYPLILSSTTNKCQPKKTLASTATIKSMAFMRRLSLAVKWVRNI